MTRIEVKTARHKYPVEVGVDVSKQLKRLTQVETGEGRLFVFYDAQFYALFGRRFSKDIRTAAPKRVTEMVLPSGEKTKSPKMLSDIYGFLLEQKITRSDFVLAVGGGVTTDLAGYAAATTLRGINWGVVPTTLLGMVDAAIGGKTGINHALGKNMIGAFWQPRFVCCDVGFLSTLPDRQLIAGLGEVLKYGGLAGGKMLKLLSAYARDRNLDHCAALTDLVALSAAYKAMIVAKDERDSGLRMLLNYGHTFGHGIETSLGYGRLLHGEAVILGIHAVLELGKRIGYESVSLTRYQELVERFIGELPKRKIDAVAVLKAMALDKKRSSTGLRFVLLEKPGKPIICDCVDQRSIEAALNRTLTVYANRGGSNA